MKILALWHDQRYLAPLIEAARFSLHELTFRAAASPDACRGKFDMIAIPADAPSLGAVRGKAPLIILDRIDGAQLGAARKCIDWPEVVRVLKGYRLRDPAMNNHTSGRLHSFLLTGRRPQNMTILHSEKIRVVWGFGAHPRFAKWFRGELPKAPARAKYPCIFAGTVKYGVSEIAAHRRAALKACGAVGGYAAAGRPLGRSEYIQATLDAGAVISPWGLGEACYRDYEALWLGKPIIKPHTDYVEGDPDIFKAGKTYFACKRDFSDLQEVLKNAHLSEAQRRESRQLAEEAFSRERIARSFDRAIG